jgi:hypothetical protein
MNVAPALSLTGCPSFKPRVRIFGPERSTRIASGRPTFFAASRARAMSCAFSSCVPCDMFMRTPLAPAEINFSMVSGSRELGPRVISIFAFLKIQPVCCYVSLSRSLQSSCNGLIDNLARAWSKASQTFHEFTLPVENERLGNRVVITHQKNY